MRLTTVFMIAAIIQVSASGFAQRVTFKAKQGTLQELFKAIKAQTGYNVVMSAEKLEAAKPVSADFKNELLEKVLEESFEGQNLTYTIDKRTIVVREKEPSFLDNLVARFSAIDVRGVVVDAETGQALAGASVKVKGAGKSTTTGSDGAFYLPGVDEKDVIVISFIGYVTQELKAKRDFGETRLVMGSADLNEVEINKGYYTEKRRLSTGSVGRVTAQEIGNQPVNNPLATLQGRVSGLVISQSTGMPGGNFSVKIRGQNSLRNINQSDPDGLDASNPLYIVDGMPYLSGSLINGVLASQTSNPYLTSHKGQSPLNSINPADIESIEILKDADATAIYGSRGANGVVLITTKKGRSGELKVEAKFYAGAGKITRRMKLQNTQQYLEMRKEAYKNDGIDWKAPTFVSYDLKTLDTIRYTDWQEELIGGTAKSTNAELSFMGGSGQFNIDLVGGTIEKQLFFREIFQINVVLPV